jgi:hypothetical protein
MTRSQAIRDGVPRGQLAALPAARLVNKSLLGDVDRDRLTPRAWHADQSR